MSRGRRKHSPAFRAKVALEAVTVGRLTKMDTDPGHLPGSGAGVPV